VHEKVVKPLRGRVHSAKFQKELMLERIGCPRGHQKLKKIDIGKGALRAKKSKEKSEKNKKKRKDEQKIELLQNK